MQAMYSGIAGNATAMADRFGGRQDMRLARCAGRQRIARADPAFRTGSCAACRRPHTRGRGVSAVLEEHEVLEERVAVDVLVVGADVHEGLRVHFRAQRGVQEVQELGIAQWVDLGRAGRLAVLASTMRSSRTR